jgi:hypothetical protein
MKPGKYVLELILVLGLVLTHGAISLPEFPVSKSHLFSFDSDSDTDPDPDPDYNPYRDRDAFDAIAPGHARDSH